MTAVESSKSRIGRLEDNLRRLRLEARIVAADATEWRGETPFARVLLDAPCSATGTIRRHPDIPHLKAAGDITVIDWPQGERDKFRAIAETAWKDFAQASPLATKVYEAHVAFMKSKGLLK